jgi:hypothetical protein
MSWLRDPVTREPLPAITAPPRPVDHAGRFVPEYEQGIAVRLRWVECHCPGCEERWARRWAELQANR